MDIAFLSQADSLTLKLELAKTALETAKSNLETAKQAFDELLAQADGHGIPKAKLKKLMEDRVQALFESGILATMGGGDAHKPVADLKRERPRRTAKKSEGELAIIETGRDKSFLGEPDAAESSPEARA